MPIGVSPARWLSSTSSVSGRKLFGRFLAAAQPPRTAGE